MIDAQRNTLGTPIDDPRWVYTRAQDYTIGGNDTIYGNGGLDVLIGGAGSDAIDGGTGDDLILGDQSQLFRRDVNPSVIVNTTSNRFEDPAGAGGAMYDTNGNLTVDASAQSFRNPDGSVPDWAEYVITIFDHSLATQTANDNSFGNDYIAGGPGNDVIFGELGNDVIQGDGSIDLTFGSPLGCVPAGTVGAGATPLSFANIVGACRDANDNLLIHPSVDNGGPTHVGDPLYADGSDYIEGGGGSDVIFGNQGQDDIVGGSSEFFGLGSAGAPARPPNMIFGGSGTDISINDYGPSTANADAHDSDAIVANNGDIVRIVGKNSLPSAGFLTFNYDTYSRPSTSSRAESSCSTTRRAGPTSSASRAAARAR